MRAWEKRSSSDVLLASRDSPIATTSHPRPIRREHAVTMLSRSALGRATQRAARQSWQQSKRGLAAPASGSFQYATGEANGIKIASRDIPGAVGNVALVSQAGTRFQPLPGLAEGLERFAFKVRNTGGWKGDWLEC